MRPKREIMSVVQLLIDESNDAAIHPRDRARAAEWSRALLWALGNDHTDLTPYLKLLREKPAPAR